MEKPNSFLRLVHNTDDPMFEKIIVAVFRRIVTKMPITQHIVWFPEDPPIRLINEAFTRLPPYVQENGLRLGEDERGFYVGFMGDINAPAFMHRALELVGISSTIIPVRCSPQFAIVLD